GKHQEPITRVHQTGPHSALGRGSHRRDEPGGSLSVSDEPPALCRRSARHFTGTSNTSFTGLPAFGSSSAFTSSFRYFSSFIVRFVWRAVSSVTGNRAIRVPVRSAPYFFSSGFDGSTGDITD